MPSSSRSPGDAVPHAAASAGPSRPSLWMAFVICLISLLVVIAMRVPFRARLLPAVLITVAFALIAKGLGGVTNTGAAAGFLVTSLLFVATGPAMFAAVFLVFVLTLLATRFGRTRKQSLSVRDPAGGRDGAQVLANLGISAIFAALSAITPYRLPLIVGSVAALAEAACDTVSSETGKALARQARLITSGRIVPAGTDGAVSMPGTMFGVLAAMLLALETVLSGLLDLRRAAIVATAGIVGMLIDSLLGATLEPRGRLSNNGVNLLSTLAAALLGTIATS